MFIQKLSPYFKLAKTVKLVNSNFRQGTVYSYEGFQMFSLEGNFLILYESGPQPLYSTSFLLLLI
jgi:hypothetical protein